LRFIQEIQPNAHDTSLPAKRKFRGHPKRPDHDIECRYLRSGVPEQPAIDADAEQFPISNKDHSKARLHGMAAKTDSAIRRYL
jgi:hypothetical protein